MTTGTTTATYRVTGMTCEHCVRAVDTELGALDGVSSVHIDLDPDGVSTVEVTSSAPLSDDQVAAALDEAGEYQLQS
ncbi:heavy-metal-associated domain-containing protein [Jatrophihabitans endophyticus]|uniref:heavy-metal-associated domain-containing protein n=1 Tax=Jatrophihabitans endophyticus TaxID=1206085 RepID=UPI0019F8005E|nr:heavy-metal-associated domain-containing protein [Jatrophihabitans endophyticus]MBE7189129.1 heavy-metal-associated domain-containing protein [Jatrophihabitans endophyticus]